MKKRVMSVMLVLVMVLGLLPTTAFAADPCSICGNTDGTHKETCRFSCLTEGCTVTYNGSTYTHSESACPYSDSALYCTECGYLEYRKDEDDYFHADNCSIGNPSQDEKNEDDKAPASIAQEYTADGVTYFGVNSKNFDKSTKLFIQDMLSAKNDVLGEKSTAALWQYLAYCIQDDKGSGTSTGKFKTQFDNVIPNGLAYNTGSTGTYSANIKSGDNKYNVRSSGLVYANSMSAAASAMEDQMFSWYRSSGGGRNDKYGSASNAAIAKNSTLWNDTDTDNVFWMVTGAYKTSGTNKKGHYQALGVLFSDFTITTILPGDDGKFYQSSTSAPVAGSITYASDVKNMTGVPVSAQQEISNTTSTTATSQINGSKSYGFEESVEVGYEHELFGGKGHVNVSFTASQTIENGWSEEKSCSDEQTTSYNVSVELPAFTNVMMKQSSSETTTTTKYNCPVALNFTVTIVEYTLDPSHNNASCKTQVLATFGANARKDLKQRGVIESTLTDPNGIVWDSLYKNHTGLQDIVENKLTATAPMASTGATFTVVNKSVTSEIGGLAPVYALSTIKTAKDIMEYNLTSGEYLYVDTIELEGLNAQNAAYYGFNQDKGHWILVGEDGNALSNSSVAKLEKNPVTGHTKLIAGQTTGTVYLKYLIDEDVYATAENPDVFRKNADLDDTAMIRVDVSEEQFKGAINVSGTLTGIVGDPVKNIEGTDGLTATVEDPTGKEVSRPVVWEAKELASKGILVKDNQISFTKEGTFHIRAKSGNVYSEWVEVTALPARELSVIQIPETATFDYKYQQTLDLKDLQISYKDQYGADWRTGAIPALTWTCNDAGASIKDGVLTVPSAGVYTVTASAGDITSNTLTITVTDSSKQVTCMSPAAKGLPACGGSVEFTITGKGLTNGITIKANDSIQATTTGTDTKQKAILSFPANTDTENEVVYTITNSLDSSFTSTVTVAKQSSGGSNGGGSNGSGDSSTCSVIVAETKNGSVAASAKTAVQGDTITLTVTPAAGYVLDTLTVTDMNGKEVKLTEQNGKYTFTMPASDVMVYANFKAVSADKPVNPFTDVPSGVYYEDAVIWAVSKGITSGTSATTFSPNASCTRGQMVTFLWRAAGSPKVSGTNPFSDVSADAYYYDAVLWAVKNGITSGTSATTFAPDATVTRGQTVTFLYRAAGSPAASGFSFSDVSSDAYYANAVAWAVQQNITSGTGNGQFSPDADCTRAQIVTFLYRFMG